MGCAPSEHSRGASSCQCRCEGPDGVLGNLVLTFKRQNSGEDGDVAPLVDLTQSPETGNPAAPRIELEVPELNSPSPSNPQDASEKLEASDCRSRTCDLGLSPAATGHATTVVTPEQLRRSSSHSSSCSSWSNDSGGSAVSASSRTSKRRSRRKMKVTETMGMVPAVALQMVIENPGKLTECYKLDSQVLGKGSFGVVRKGSLKATGASRAVKSISMEHMKEKTDLLKQEIAIMKMIDHPSTVMLFEVFEDEEHIHLVMELCVASLRDRVQKAKPMFSEKEASLAMWQVLRAVFYLHGNGIVHRDLKEENILTTTPPGEPLQRTSLKVTDFGLSTLVKPGQVFTTVAGSLSHMAPEVLEKRYDHMCDMWSCGVILYFLLSGKYPFRNQEEVQAGKYSLRSERWSMISQDAVSLLSHLLTKNPKTRFTAKQALACSWIKEHTTLKEVELRQKLVQELQDFRSLNKFKQASLCIIASMLPESEVGKCRDLFAVLDEDGDGTITLAELERRLTELSKTEDAKAGGAGGTASSSLRKAFKDVVAGTNVLKSYRYTEFLAATLDMKKCLRPPILRAAFACFDRNGDGGISMAELGSGHLLGHLSMEELAEILEGFDEDGDHHIDFGEFTNMMVAAAPVLRRDNSPIMSPPTSPIARASPTLRQEAAERSASTSPAPPAPQAKAARSGAEAAPPGNARTPPPAATRPVPVPTAQVAPPAAAPASRSAAAQALSTPSAQGPVLAQGAPQVKRGGSGAERQR